MKYLTPFILMGILVWWLVKDAVPTLLMEGVPEANIPYIWAARILMLSLLAGLFYIINRAWSNKK